MLVILVGGLPITRLKTQCFGGTQHLFEGRVPLRTRMKPVSYLSMGDGLIPSGPAPSRPAPFSPPFTPPILVLLPAYGPSSSTLGYPCLATASPKGPRYPSGSLGSQPLTSPQHPSRVGSGRSPHSPCLMGYALTGPHAAPAPPMTPPCWGAHSGSPRRPLPLMVPLCLRGCCWVPTHTSSTCGPSMPGVCTVSIHTAPSTHGTVGPHAAPSTRGMAGPLHP